MIDAPLIDNIHALISEYGEIETAERYKSIYESFDQETYGKAAQHLEEFLAELILIKKREVQNRGNLTLSEVVSASLLKPNVLQ